MCLAHVEQEHLLSNCILLEASLLVGQAATVLLNYSLHSPTHVLLATCLWTTFNGNGCPLVMVSTVCQEHCKTLCSVWLATAVCVCVCVWGVSYIESEILIIVFVYWFAN